MNENEARIYKDKIAKFTRVIKEQAEALIARQCAPSLAALQESLKAFGIKTQPQVRLVEVWEDINGQLPPKVIAELVIAHGGSQMASRFDVPVGAFHLPGKADHIFELCMLRAEANLEFEGRCDGHTIERMVGLEKELGI